MDSVIFGLDIGTSKICAVVGEVREGNLQIIGLGTTPSRGMRKGMVTNVAEASVSIAKAIEQAEQTSGYDLSHVVVGLTGEHINSVNNAGAVAIGKTNGVVSEDINRALDAAQAIPIPHNRQIVHLLPRTYTIDDQNSIRSPLGMHGFRLEVEAHIVTAASPAVQNLNKCADVVGLQVEEFVLNSLAAAEAVLTPAEKEMGVLVADIGEGTTDIALYYKGSPWFSRSIPVGGGHITNDIAIGLRVPFEVAEDVKIQYADCRPDTISENATFTVEPFSGERIHVGRKDLAYVVEARVEEFFTLILEALKESGYKGLLPAGIVLTGGSAQIRGITDVAQKVLGLSARVARPNNLIGLVESLNSPAYASSVGLLRWAMSEHHVYQPHEHNGQWGKKLSTIFRALLPG